MQYSTTSAASNTADFPADDGSIPPHIPDITADDDNLSAALKYADAGWYVLPVKRGSKAPGSIVGKHWQDKSSGDPQVIAAWFAGTDHNIALHCGRSGVVVFDVDHPDKLPEKLSIAIETCPYQSSRPDQPGRGHYVFAMPLGRSIGNSSGKLGADWGEVRGLNGVIIAAPSQHSTKGCEYRWERTGVVPELPEDLAALLADASPAEDAATDSAVHQFIAEHADANRPDLVDGWVDILCDKIDKGQSRHTSAVSVVVGAMKEARAGYFPAGDALKALRRHFTHAVQQQPTSDKQGSKRTEAQAVSEWRGIVAWAVGQALAADLDEIHARVRAKKPEKEAPKGVGAAGEVLRHNVFRDVRRAVAGCAPDSNGEVIDGATLLDDIGAFLARFVAYPSDDAKVAHTLWIAHTWLMDCWDSTPRIAFLSPEPGSGKTRALEASEPLVPNPIHSVNVTSAYLFRKIEDAPTVLYDEVDTVFGPKA